MPTWDEVVALATAGDVKAATAHWLTDPAFDVARTRPVWARIREMVEDYDAGHWTGASKLRWASSEAQSD
jgi:hypothetical protein